MALDPHYITDGPLEEAFLDKSTGLPLAGGTLTFYRDSSRITAKPVYELTGAPPNYSYVPLDNPLTLSSIGTVQNAGGDNVVIYYYPWLADGSTLDLYYVVVQDSNGVEQFTREAWPNLAVDEQNIIDSTIPAQNQISNPQFTRILINDVPGLTPATTVYNVTAASNQVFAFAPDWNFVLSGTGSVTVQRIALAGSNEAPTSPPYVLDVQVSGGLTSCYLSQRFYTNSGLWTSTSGNAIFLSTALMARNETGADTPINMYYHASSGVNNLLTPIFSNNIPTGDPYTLYTGASSSAIPVSDDANSGTSGYVDIYISFAANSHVKISSVQVVPTFDATVAATFSYDEASANRDQALLGSYYLPRVTRSPIPSLLTAWDFPLNPAQFGATQTITAGTPAYVWDQTICYSNVGNVAVARNSITNALQFTPASNNDALYMLQYLTGAQAKELLYNRLSSNISAYLAANVGVVTVQAYLFVGTAASVIPILPTTIGTMNNLGGFTPGSSGWTTVDRSGLDIARAQVMAVNPTINNDIQFTGWEIVQSGQLSDTAKCAMVVTFAWTTAPVINLLSISLNKGDLPTRPAAQTLSSVLSDCQYYFEKSYNSSVVAGTASSPVGALIAMQGSNPDTSTSGNDEIATRSFGITYKIPKRTAATVTLYSPVTGASANVSYNFFYKGVTQTGAGYPYDQGLQTGTNPNIIGWVQTGNGQYGTYYISNSQIVIDHPASVQNGTDETFILFHFSADCRLGIIA